MTRLIEDEVKKNTSKRVHRLRWTKCLKLIVTDFRGKINRQSNNNNISQGKGRFVANSVCELKLKPYCDYL